MASPARSAGSRLTLDPCSRVPRLVRASVSGTVSKASVPASCATTVRQTPPTETESPISPVTEVSTTRRPSCIERTVPMSRTRPVNTGSVAVDERLDGLAHEHLELGAFPRSGRLELGDQL